MFDPREAERLKASVFDEHVPAPLGHDISPSMRTALIALLSGPAEFLPGSPHAQKWQAPGDGRLQRLADNTIQALANRNLVIADPRSRPGKRRIARLTWKGKWYAHKAAADFADQLMAAAKARTGSR